MDSATQPGPTTEVGRVERPLPPLPPSSPSSTSGDGTIESSLAVRVTSDSQPEGLGTASHGASLGAVQDGGNQHMDQGSTSRSRSRSSSYRLTHRSRSASKHGSFLRPKTPESNDDLYSAENTSTLSRTSSVHGGGTARSSRRLSGNARESTSRSRSPSQTLLQALQLPHPSASRTSPSGSDSDDDTPLLSHTSPSQIRQRQQPAPETPSAEFVVPRWQPDAEVTMCPICRTQFGFFVRKHHCRKCGRVVCSACSPHRITIPFQYIVQPPSDGSPTAATVDRRGSTDTRVDSWNSVASIGGGERVRLCNPCVPDPNTAPPQSPLPRLHRSSPRSHTPSVSMAMPSNSLDHYRSREEVDRLITGFPRRPRGETSVTAGRPPNSVRGMTLPGRDDRGLRPDASENRSRSSTVGNPRETNHMQSQYPGTVNAFSARSPPGAIHQAFRPHTTRMDDHRSRELPPRPRQAERRRIPEEDECWICHLELPSRTLPNFEKLREAHVESCLAAAMGCSSPTPAVASLVPARTPSVRVHSSSSTSQAQASSSTTVPVPIANTPEARMAAREQAHAAVVFAQSHPSSPGPVRRTGVFPYQATEKDCVDDAECTICLEEFEPGVEMGRLECFCRFHLHCIRQWFEKHPGQCPVHEVRY